MRMSFAFEQYAVPETIQNKIYISPNPNEEGMVYGTTGYPNVCNRGLYTDTENCATLTVGEMEEPEGDFNIVLQSVSLNPKTIPVGGQTTFKVFLQNTGTIAAPAGLIVQVLVNGTVIVESTPMPIFPAGQSAIGTTVLTASSEGTATICGRIKEGFYNTLPQQKCDTITVGGSAGDFNVILTSVTIVPNQIEVGYPAKMTIKMVNTGTDTAPAGLVLQIKRNGILVAESNPCDPIPSGNTVTGEMNFSEVETGTHTFCARIKEGYYDTAPQEKCATITVGTITFGTINITSTPIGAEAYMDSIYKGITPLSIENVTPGQHIILLKKTGYTDYTTTIDVTAGVVSTVSATLETSGGNGGEGEPSNLNLGLIFGVAGIALLGGVMLASSSSGSTYKKK